MYINTGSVYKYIGILSFSPLLAGPQILLRSGTEGLITVPVNNLYFLPIFSCMGSKEKGSNAERELIHAFWKSNWAAIRTAGSGSNKYPSPDVLAGNAVRRIAVECKASGGIKKYLTVKEVTELKQFAALFGAEPWIGIRFNDMNWYFLAIDDLERTGSSFSVSIELAKKKGLLFEQLIS